MSVLRYRPARASDLEGVYRLVCGLEGEALPRQAFSEIFASQLALDCWHGFVCTDGNAVVGLLNLRIEAQLHHAARVAEVLELVVDPACRGLGIGSELLRLARECAAENDCVLIEAACNLYRTNAHRFYQRKGMSADHYRFSLRL